MCALVFGKNVQRGYTRGAPRDMIVLIKSPQLHSLRVQSWTAICLLISFPDESKDSVGDDAYERRDNQYNQELTHGFTLLAQNIDPF